MSEKSPAAQFYFRDFLADTAHLTNEEVGIYIRWISYAWVGLEDCEQGELPNDDEFLRHLVGIGRKKMASTGARPKRLFKVVRGKKIAHKRLLEERQKQIEWSEKSRRGGLASAKKRKGGDAVVQPPLQPEGEPKGNSSSATAPALATTREEKKESESEAVVPRTEDPSPGQGDKINFQIGRLLLSDV